MSRSATTHAVPASDLSHAEAYLTNADLRLKRRVLAGDLTREEYAAHRKHIDAALGHLRLIAVAVDAPSLAALARSRPAQTGANK